LWLVSFALAAVLGCHAAARPVVSSPLTPGSSQQRIADALIELAKQRDLASGAGWRKLVHYRTSLISRQQVSDADGPSFFLSERGKTDPFAELAATIRALLAPAAGTQPADLDAHAACRFPARTMFLIRELGLSPSWLGASSCPDFDRYLSELRPTGVSLIFTSYYLNNPSSAFGHTFLRIHKESYAVGERRELLDYGIDFSADVTTKNPIAYTVMGLTGLFHGTFKRMPYYYKVREYNDTESRDLWEYELALDDAQRWQLVAHLWELGHTDFDYFYLGENCSYAILGVIDAARPELDLMRHVSSPVIPATTVQIMRAQPGLVRSVHYRPALRTQLDAKLAGLTRDEVVLVAALGRDPEAPLGLPDKRAILVLDAAADLIDIRHAKELLTTREGAAAKHKQRLLERRAALRVPSPEVPVPTDLNSAPERGHRARRVGLLAGRDAAHEAYYGLDFRLALHDLADASYGYPEGAQIEFLHAQVRMGEVKDRFKVRLDRLDVVRVISLSSMERFKRHISFQLAAGLLGVLESKTRTQTAGHVLLGSGLARGVLHDALLVWAMADAQLLVGLPFSDSARGERVPLRIGAGPSGGLRARLHPTLVLLGTASYYWYPAQLPDARYQLDATLRWEFARDFAVGAETRLHRYGLEAQGLLYAYF
jgi:Domain of unknown function (DUF4105)